MLCLYICLVFDSVSKCVCVCLFLVLVMWFDVSAGFCIWFFIGGVCFLFEFTLVPLSLGRLMYQPSLLCFFAVLIVCHSRKEIA